jgi:hypothetical protein
VACSQLNQLDTPGGEEGAGVDEQGVGPLPHKTCEGRVDLSAGAGIEGCDLHSNRTASGGYFSQRGFGIGIVRINQHCHARRSRHQLTQELEPLGRELPREKVDAGQVAARSGEVGDKTKLDRVVTDHENDGNRRRCRLGCECGSNPAGRGDGADPSANQFRRQLRQPIKLILRPSVFDRDVLTFDIASVFESLAECAETVRVVVR